MSSEGLVSITNLIPAGHNIAVAQHGNDRGLIAEFYMEAVEQTFESEKQGRKVYKDVPYIHIFAPGQKSDIRRPIRLEEDGRTPPDNIRFPAQYAAFQNQCEQPQIGMPLEKWAVLSKGEVLEWKSAKVHTVEQIAALPDNLSDGMPMNFRSVRDKAISWLATATGDQAIVSGLQSENKVLKEDVAMLKQQIAELAAKQTEQRGPGRPRKVEGVTANGD